jgi:hypothetical protein
VDCTCFGYVKLTGANLCIGTSWNHLPGAAAELNVKKPHLVEFISIYCNFKAFDFHVKG